MRSFSRSITFPIMVAAMLDGRPLVSAQVAQPLNIDADDSLRVAWLHQHGRQLQGQHVVAWYPEDSLAEAQVRRLVAQLDQALPVLQQAIGGPYPWQGLGTARVEYYLAPDRFVSHARGRAVFVSSWRAREGKAPLLHETVHVPLFVQPPPSMTPSDSLQAARMEDSTPDWLAEGLPDAVAQTTAATLSFPEYDVFQSGGPEKVDSTCAARLRGAHAEKVLPFIGAAGAPPALYTTDRQQVAPIFYPCAHSFTGYVMSRASAPYLASLFPEIRRGRVAALLEARLGQPMSRLRRDWLAHLPNASPAASP